MWRSTEEAADIVPVVTNARELPRPAGPRDGLVAVEPPCWRRDALVSAVEAGGGTVVGLDEASALIWADPTVPEQLPDHARPNIDWVQLPFAGIEPFLPLLDRARSWTCGKGVYAQPVAEHVLTSLLTGFRAFTHYARQDRWSGPVGRSLHGAHVLVLGGGGITEALLPLLAPFACRVTVLRRSPEPLAGADAVATLDELDALLPTADAVVLALAVTPETRGVIGERQLELMAPHALLVNVARGVHVETDALVAALAGEKIGGAVLDVTDPEPLPDDHPLWDEPRCLVTPHIGNTPEMGLVLLAERVAENVHRYRAGEPLLGPVDLDLGY